MENKLLKYIKDGRITNIGELRRLYRRIVLRTHPDSIGSDKLVNEFIEFSNYYEEAKALLVPINVDQNHRLHFFRAMSLLERIELPYNQDKQTKRSRIDAIKNEAHAHFVKWKGDCAELYELANREYDSIQKEKPRGPYRKHALYANLRPVFHNIVAYHLSGSSLYQRQIRQNLEAVMLRLKERHFFSLSDYLKLLIEDMKNGPAVFD